MPDPQVTKCPICGGMWFEGECYKCGAYLEDGKVIPPKRENPPPPVPPQPAPVQVPPVRPWDDP